mmetsp:Transcript_16216/g.50858  ORF Transcript_16216/g.50858 Transcript_16216/m.50858 type:complete len:108 (+) Transcript_16216:460-783(+)
MTAHSYAATQRSAARRCRCPLRRQSPVWHSLAARAPEQPFRSNCGHRKAVPDIDCAPFGDCDRRQRIRRLCTPDVDIVPCRDDIDSLAFETRSRPPVTTCLPRSALA